VEPPVVVAPSVSSTAWDVCSARPSPGRYAFMPGGDVSLEGNFVHYLAQLGHWTWSQKGNRVVFGSGDVTTEVKLDGDTMLGYWHMLATPKQSYSICLRRIVVHP
jgi:hypothetical protein